MGKNENVETSPQLPALCPSKLAPNAWAASSISAIPCRSASSRNAPQSPGCPKMCTSTIARVRSVTAASAATGSRQSVTGSMSAKTGVAPVRAIASAVA